MAKTYSDRYLNAPEASDVRTRERKRYYRFLAKQALVLRGKEFWDHYRRWLATLERKLEWGRLAWMVTLEGLRLLLNPLSTGRRLVQRLRRNTSA